MSLANDEVGWSGHSWHHATSRRSLEGAVDGECKGSVEPSIYVISDRWFEVNDTVPVDVKQVLLETWEFGVNEAGRGRLPAVLDTLETVWRPEDEE